ncbi:hypothetical protein [Streptomyces chartreusis]|uniref:hypothetical protein n=1 Tax=Streptomyces chartreusis TaxID=1969 RepID=UPI00381CD352
MATVADGIPRELRALSMNPVGILADLTAVHLYLSDEWKWLDEAVIGGRNGPHLPLARCVAAGLRRLPPYRGPVIARTGLVDVATDWYRENSIVIDRAFWTASAAPSALAEGGPGFLVWSLTGRWTKEIDPDTSARVVFSPGTGFKVLQVTGGPHPLVLMRELLPPELAAHRFASRPSHQTKWLDESTVENLMQAIEKSARDGSAKSEGQPGRCPGLIFTANAAEATVGSSQRERIEEAVVGLEAVETEEQVRVALRAAWSAEPRNTGGRHTNP